MDWLAMTYLAMTYLALACLTLAWFAWARRGLIHRIFVQSEPFTTGSMLTR
jgi:hypothetical protein